jgi:Ca-activated chloride channel family protein
MLLRDSEHKAQCSWPAMVALAREARGPDVEGYRAEFIRLAETAQMLAAGREVPRGQ